MPERDTVAAMIDRARALEGERHERYRQVVRRAAEEAMRELDTAVTQQDWDVVARVQQMFVGLIAGVDEAWIKALPLPNPAASLETIGEPA